MRDSIAAHPDWLAGTDPDAEMRAVLRRSVPESGHRAPTACLPCLASAQAERDVLDQLAGLASHGPDPALTLCAEHLADAAATTGGRPASLVALLAWQAECLTAKVNIRSPHWLRAGRRHRAPAGGCAMCRARRDAAQRALADVSAAHRLRAGSALCVRHHLVLRVAYPRVSQALAPAAVEAASVLIGELSDAFDSAARARNRGTPAPESSAWRRAAVFLDGAVFGGYPARAR
jgi:hypothetical protein